MSSVVAILRKEGLYVDISEIINKMGKEYYNKFRNKYTLSTYNNMTKQQRKFIIYTIVNNKYILIPRFEGLKSKMINTVVNKINKHFTNIEMDYKGSLIKNQKLISTHLLDNVYNAENKKLGKAGCILKMPAGCHAIDTPILLFNGTIKLVQNIKISDQLMGDDSTPRNIIKLINNRACMYKIIDDNNGVTYTVNGDHILCLQRKSKYNYYLDDDEIVEITVLDYLKLSIKERNKLYAYRAPVKFKLTKVSIDPYIVGYMIGKHIFNQATIKPYHNSTKYPHLYIDDTRVYQYISNKLVGGTLRANSDTNRYTIDDHTNTITDYLTNLNLFAFNGIPYEYLVNSRHNRLKLLAGILDASSSQFTFTTSKHNVKLINDFVFLIRSLGNNVSKYYTNETVQLTIDQCSLPSIAYDNVRAIKLDTHINLYKFTIEKLNVDNYYGFQLDGNNRYIMGDCTVTHNTGKSFVAMNMINQLKTKTLIIVPNTYLLKQWVQLLTELFPNNKIGEYYSKRKIDGDIVVSIINSCTQDEFKYTGGEKLSIVEYYNQFNFVILDECHMYCTKTFGVVFNRIQSTYMLGLSATPDERLDGFDSVARYHLGDILDVECIQYYNKEDIKFTSNVKVIKYNGPDEFTQTIINEKNNMVNVPAIISNFIIDDHRNNLIVNETVKLLAGNHNIFIFSDRRSHLVSLSELLINKVKTDHKIILYGGSSNDDIELAQKNSKIILTTYQYSSTGVSISKMDALILSTPRRNNMTQIIGRIFRLNKETQANLRSIIDIVDNKNPLKYQFNGRKAAYTARGSSLTFETVNYSDIL